jgi:predicted RNase H-related nuclease YkuK (DUF458 family)
MSVEHEIKEIKEAMLKHNQDDKVSFGTISRELSELKKGLEANHDVHIRNEETLKNILEQSRKTDGRVTSLENVFSELNTSNKLLHQIVSQQHHQYEKYVLQMERIKEGESDKYVSLTRYSLVEKIVYGFVALLLTAFGVALIALIIKS